MKSGDSTSFADNTKSLLTELSTKRCLHRELLELRHQVAAFPQLSDSAAVHREDVAQPTTTSKPTQPAAPPAPAEPFVRPLPSPAPSAIKPDLPADRTRPAFCAWCGTRPCGRCRQLSRAGRRTCWVLPGPIRRQVPQSKNKGKRLRFVRGIVTTPAMGPIAFDRTVSCCEAERSGQMLCRKPHRGNRSAPGGRRVPYIFSSRLRRKFRNAGSCL